ncbi:VCBS repeat-containing protein [Polaribacter sp. Q13]|uniref:FG-GAP repeat domain-containing protein n=1 Tax=Polaribacter sp. Q13 TaxID=2806551 RepID=UPI00193B5E57|nr:VCBS repeat-containing protein [Polaribacter sp. Q13]QVY65039.1 VCBS repeat-containing protein [Polaribacter sp. Q13]
MRVTNSKNNDHSKLPYWRDSGVSKTGRQDTYISIISEPAKDKVKRVVFIAAGQQSDDPTGSDGLTTGNYGNGYTNVLTGQPNNYKEGLRHSDNLETTSNLNNSSLASKLIKSGEFPEESTLFVLAFDARLGYFQSENETKRRETAFFNLLTSKFNPSNVEVIVLSGQSRGGALAFRLGSRLRSNSTYTNIPLIVQGYDPVAANPVLAKTPNLLFKLPNLIFKRQIEEYLPINSKNDKLKNPNDYNNKYCWKVNMDVTFPTEKRDNLKVYIVHSGDKVSGIISESIRAFAWKEENTDLGWYKQHWLNFGHEEMGGCNFFNNSDCLFKTVESGYQHIIYSIPTFKYELKEKIYSYHSKPVVGYFNTDLEELKPIKKIEGLKSAKKTTIKNVQNRTISTNNKTKLKSLKSNTITQTKPHSLTRKKYLDIIYYGKCGNGSDCWRTHLNDKNGKFNITSYGDDMWFQGDKPVNAPVAGDFNKDGYTDIAYYGKCNNGSDCWRVHLNDKNGKFTVTSYGGDIWFKGDKPVSAPVAGDFNKDGYTDIAYYGKCNNGDDCWRVHLNNKNGKFTVTSYGGDMWFQDNKPVSAPVAGDFNKDGYTDIAYYGKCGNGDDCWRVHLNDKNGKFTVTSYGGDMWFKDDKPINAPVAGDFNRDGYTDIAYYGKCGNGDDCWRVNLNDKNGKFTVTSYGSDMWFKGEDPVSAPVAGDFNRDGYTDIAYYGKCGNGDDCWRVHLNDKNGKFTITSYGGDLWFKE